MFNVNRRQFATFIMAAFLLIEWQFYSHNIKLGSFSKTGTIEKLSPNPFPAPGQKLINEDDLINSIESIKEPTTSGVHKTTTVIYDQQLKESNSFQPQRNELYQVITNYSNDKSSGPQFKRILFWNKFQGNKNYGVGQGRDALLKWGCPVWQCETSENRTQVQNYDAVIIHLRSWNKRDLPQRRLPHQRYVFFNLESSAWNRNIISSMANFFNWTMTYRWDSDFVHPYGYITPTGNVPLHPSEVQMKKILSHQKVNYATGKTKMAAWFVSNCRTVQSSRNELIQELQKYMKVDVYGKCGKLKCRKKLNEDNSSEECRDMVAKKYKFYFALENSLCRHYVTEKFFENMRRPIIPVVFGLHDDHEQLAPPHSFINAAKFKSMKSLADYLILLDRNDTLYNEYFWWKDQFHVHDSQKDKNVAMCHLCAALHDVTLPPKIYANLTDWWTNKSNCISSPIIS